MQIKDLNFQRIEQRQTLLDGEADILFAAKTDLGGITVLDRMTGYGHRDTETGFKDADGEFWLASGQFDIRAYPELPVEDAITLIKERANECPCV
jgi:hypothetical protein